MHTIFSKRLGNFSRLVRAVTFMIIAIQALVTTPAFAQPGTLLTTIPTAVSSPTPLAVGIAADCEDPTTLYYTHAFTATLYKMDNLGVALGVPIPIFDAVTGASLSIGAIQWDQNRGMLWGGTDDSGVPVQVYLIDPATGAAFYQFTAASPGFGFTDGISYDSLSGTVYVSDDVSDVIDEHDATSPWGLVRSFTPTDAAGNTLGLISGVLVGKGDILYVGRNGNGTVDQIKKSDGSLLGSFAAPGFRVEDMECDLNSFAPLEAIWVKEAYTNQVAAFEVEPGTCQCGGGDADLDGVPDGDDLCPDTVIAEGVPTIDLGVNRWALLDGDLDFDTTPPHGKGPKRHYSTTDTAGCSCEQIIEAQDLGKGHEKYGCSISAMDDWVELVNQ